MGSKQKMSKLHLALVFIAVLIISAVVLILIISFQQHSFEVLNYISVVSSFSVAILTILYVFTTNNQMSIMKLQLDEMQHEHILKEQPILLLDEPKFEIQRPNFYYTPPTDRFSFKSIYNFSATLINSSDDPAIVVRIAVLITIPQIESPLILKTIPVKYNFLSAKSDPKSIRFHFTGDTKGALFNAIRERKDVTVSTFVCYKNTSGAHFAIRNNYCFNLYLLSSSNKKIKSFADDGMNSLQVVQIIGNWHTAIVQAPIKYKELLGKLRELKDNKDRYIEFEKVFQNVRDDMASLIDFKDSLVGSLYDDNESFEFSPITKAEYDEFLKNSMSFQELISDCKNDKNSY